MTTEPELNDPSGQVEKGLQRPPASSKKLSRILKCECSYSVATVKRDVMSI